jgi:hypothetical protein
MVSESSRDAFANVTTVTQVRDGVPVLIIEGAIASTSAHAVEVPLLRLSIRNSDGQEVYAWTEWPERSMRRRVKPCRFAPGSLRRRRARATWCCVSSIAAISRPASSTPLRRQDQSAD